MDEKYTNDNLLIERYLQGTLTDEETAAFEEAFLSSSELLDELEAAETLQKGMRDVVALEKARHPEGYRDSGVSLYRVKSLFQSPRYAMAASVMLLVSLGVSGVLYQQNMLLSEGVAGAAAPVDIVQLVSVRGFPGGEPVNKLVLGGQARQFVLMLDPGFGDFSHHRATVFRLDPVRGPVRIWRVDKLRPGYQDMLALTVSGATLAVGDFEIRLEGWRDEWPAGHAWEFIETISFSTVFN